METNPLLKAAAVMEKIAAIFDKEELIPLPGRERRPAAREGAAGGQVQRLERLLVDDDEQTF